MHCTVTCPTCFETFSVRGPTPGEMTAQTSAKGEAPVQWDYDCEVCCRPMVIHFYLDEGAVYAEAVADQ